MKLLWSWWRHVQCNILHCFSGNLLKHNTCNLTRADHILVYHERYIIATTITSHSFIQVTIVSHQALHKYPGVNTTFQWYDHITIYIFLRIIHSIKNAAYYDSREYLFLVSEISIIIDVIMLKNLTLLIVFPCSQSKHVFVW